MRRLILVAATVGALGLGSTAASAAPMQGLAVTAPAPAVTLVQGWWEEENHGDASDRYWQLKPADRKRYDAAEARIQKRHDHHVDHYSKTDARDLATEHRLLHYGTHS